MSQGVRWAFSILDSQNFSQPYLSSGNSSVHSFPVIVLSLLDVLCAASWGLNMCIYSLLFSQICVDFCSPFLSSSPLSRHIFSHAGLPELWSLSLQISQNFVLCLGSFSLCHYLENATKQKTRAIIRLTSFVSQSCSACCPTSNTACFLCFVQF